MIGFVQFFNTFQGFSHRNTAPIDFLRLANDAGDRPEPASDPERAGVGESGQLPIEHARVKLVRLPVEIEIGARETSP